MSAQLHLLSGNLSICRIWRWPRSPAYLGHRDHCHQGPPTASTSLWVRHTQGPHWPENQCLALLLAHLAVLAQIHVVYLKVIVTMTMNALAVFYVDQIIVFLHLNGIHLNCMMTAAMTLF